MENRKEIYRFDADVLKEMDNFEKDFLSKGR